MYCFTSSTVKKCRATSSIPPRQAKRGRSTRRPGGTDQALAILIALCSASMPAGNSCRGGRHGGRHGHDAVLGERAKGGRRDQLQGRGTRTGLHLDPRGRAGGEAEQ